MPDLMSTSCNHMNETDFCHNQENKNETIFDKDLNYQIFGECKLFIKRQNPRNIISKNEDKNDRTPSSGFFTFRTLFPWKSSSFRLLSDKHATCDVPSLGHCLGQTKKVVCFR